MQHRARKRFGQNFLHDPAAIGRIIDAIAPRPGQRLVEIGPGQGAITAGLLRATGRMTAIELDRDLIAPLKEKLDGLGELQLINADALAFDFHSLANGDKLRLVGNLPYNISTPILFHLLLQAEVIQDMHFLLQKEVVARMAAEPGSKTYGRLSVMIQAYCRVRSLFDIGPGAFKPAPKVDSAFVRLQPLPPEEILPTDADSFARVVTQAFSQRRKTLRNTLKPLMPEKAIRDSGLDPGIRAEQVDIAGFARLAEHLTKL